MSENQHNELPLERANQTPTRRSLLIGGTSAAAAGVVGVAAGVGVGGHEVPPAPRGVSSQRRFTGKVVMITGGSGPVCGLDQS